MLTRADLSELDEEVRSLIIPHIEDEEDAGAVSMLSKIGLALATKRDEAVSARKESGIEQVWKECEEAYIGIDDANRADFQAAKWSKPMAISGPITTGSPTKEVSKNRSSAFFRLTARYVEAGSAKVGEILIPPDDKAFSFTETPDPSTSRGMEENKQVVHEELGPLTRPAGPQDAPQQMETGQGPAAPTMAAASLPAPVAAPAGGAVLPAGAVAPPPRVPLTTKDLAEEKLAEVRKKAEKAEKRVYDWMVECQHSREMRKVIFDAARIGVGVLKGPIPYIKRGMVLKKTEEGSAQIEFKESIKPGTKRVDPWDIFPDASCGENIHDGDYVFERDRVSEKKLRGFKKLPGYLSAQIDKVIKEGPDKENAKREANTGQSSGHISSVKGRYEIWYYYGTMSKEDLDCVSESAKKSMSVDPDEMVDVIATIINDTVIKATFNPLDSGSYPYHSVPWQRRDGQWAGVGVAEQLFTPQKMINAGIRAMLNNAGKSAGSQIVVDRNKITPADGEWLITPDKIWNKTGEDDSGSVKDAFEMYKIVNVTQELMQIIQFAMTIAEESTSIPLVTQGQSGPTTPDTLGGMELQNNNANQLLRSIGYAFDDYITEPLVRMYYEWLLLDPDVPNDEKGDFDINAHGSSALVERAIQDQSIANMASIVGNPIYGIDPKRWATELIKSKKMSPERLKYSKEDQAKIDSAPPPEDPRITAAKITAAVSSQNNQQRNANESHRTQVNATISLHELSQHRELELLKYANEHKMSVDQVAASLEKTRMTLDVQKELTIIDKAAGVHDTSGGRDQVASPAAEPPGRAADGKAFIQ